MILIILGLFGTWFLYGMARQSVMAFTDLRSSLSYAVQILTYFTNVIQVEPSCREMKSLKV